MNKINSNLTPGNYVFHNEEEYCISEVLDLESLLCRNINSGRYKTLPIREITFEKENGEELEIELSKVEEASWAAAVRKFEVIKPLLVKQPNLTSATLKVAQESGVHQSTIYRWLKAYKSSNLISSLLEAERPGGERKSRLKDSRERLLMATIEKEFLIKKKSIPGTIEQVRVVFYEAGLKAPHENTVRRRIGWIDEKKKLKAFKGQKEVDHIHGAIEGPFPNADSPLSVVQIDHTELDIMIVDDAYRLPIGRPWITLAIDIYSRVIVGFYISLEPPSAMSVGLCLSQGILLKDELVDKYKTESRWNVWGFMGVVHADNAKEFRGEMLQRVCREYGITLEWRPVARPNYGAHIERLLGTFSNKIHDLPGTTYSNIKDKGDYDSEKNAIFTLNEINQWFMYQAIDIYHNDFHSGISTPPMAKYEEGILGTAESLGRGLPKYPENEEKLRIDFLPCIERTVQKDGITWDNISYFHDVLRTWINLKDPKTNKKKTYIVRRDPRDISHIYFYDEEQKRYYKIPYRNPAHPSVSLWEWRAVDNYIKDKGLSKVDEGVKFRALIKLRKMEEEAAIKTKKARRNVQRRNEASKTKKEELKKEEKAPSNVVKFARLSSTKDTGIEIQPFDDLEG